MTARLRTAVIGFGKIGGGYADDPVMARHFRYATHAQVLRDHPAFAWEAVVDPSPEARELARSRWGVPRAFATVAELAAACRPDVAVLATPPGARLEAIESLPSLRAVLVEKPLGARLAEARAFVAVCQQRGVLVQVNLLRRADDRLRALAASELTDLIGPPQAVFGLYGNGLANNGTHMIDLVRMLLGEVVEAAAVPGVPAYAAGPIPGDVHVPLFLRLTGGVVATLHPLRFEHYRENALDLWGEKGRLAITQEGLALTYHPRRPNRATRGEHEVASDEPTSLGSTLGTAFYRMYDNLADAVTHGAPLWSPAESALRTAEVIEEVLAPAPRVRKGAA